MSHMNALEGDETTHHVPSSRHDKSYSDDLHKPHETVSFMKLEDGHTSMSHMNWRGTRLQITFRLLDTTNFGWDLKIRSRL